MADMGTASNIIQQESHKKIATWSNTWARMKADKFRYFLILPGLLYFIVYKYIPIYGILAAFQKFNLIKGISGSEWIGFRHFESMFLYGDFQSAIVNTIVISLMKLITIYVWAIIMSLLLYELKDSVFKKAVQTISYLPHFLSWVALYGIFMVILSPQTGSLIKLLHFIGVQAPDMFTDPRYFRWLLTLSNLWREAGWCTIIYVAALTSIDPGIFEAAIIDGANRLQRAWYISIPGILPIITIMLILSIGHILNENLEQILQFYNPIVKPVSQVFETIVYEKGMQGMNYGYATAVGLFQSTAGLILTLFANWASKKAGQDGLW